MNVSSLRVPTILLAAVPIAASGLTCPDFPSQTAKDISTKVEATVGSVGKLKAGEVTVQANAVTRDLLGKLPGANVLYIEQMMYATYCTALRDSKNLSEEEKASKLLDASKGVRAAIRGRVDSGSLPSPRPTSPSSAPASKQTSKPPKSADVNTSSNKNVTAPVRAGEPGNVTVDAPIEASTVTSVVPTTTIAASGGATVVVVNPVVVSTQISTPAVTVSAAPFQKEDDKVLPDPDVSYEWLNENVSIRGDCVGRREPKKSWTVDVTWRQLFGELSPYLMQVPHEDVVRRYIAKFLGQRAACSPNALSFDLTERDWHTITIKFRFSGLVKIAPSETTDGSVGVFWEETERGRVLMREIRGK